MEVQSIDFKQANAVLGKIRASLAEEEAAWGPDSVQQDVAHLDGAPGVGGASNVADIEDALDGYLTGIADALLAKYDVSEDEAYDFIFYAAETAEALGMLPMFPDEDAADSEFAAWYGKAGSVKFDAMVMNLAAKEL
jgi:hypothetical protein